MFDNSVVVDLFIPVDVVHNTSEVLLIRVNIHGSPLQTLEKQFRDGLTSAANFLFVDTNVLISSMFVVAEGGQTLRHNWDGISFHHKPL
jgi:hypothetical protein